jgi:hypothetical protein
LIAKLILGGAVTALLKDVLTGDEKSSLSVEYFRETRRFEQQSQTDDEVAIKEEPDVKDEPLSQPLDEESVRNGSVHHNEVPEVKDEPLSQPLDEESLNNGSEHHTEELEVKEEPLLQHLNEESLNNGSEHHNEETEVKEDPLLPPLNKESLNNGSDYRTQELEVTEEPLSQQQNQIKEEPLLQPLNDETPVTLQQIGRGVPEVIEVSDDDDESVANITRQPGVDSHHSNYIATEKGGDKRVADNTSTDIDDELLSALIKLPDIPDFENVKSTKKKTNRKRKFSDLDSENHGWGDLPEIDGPPSPSMLENETMDDLESDFTTASRPLESIPQVRPKPKKAKNKTSSKLRAKGKSHSVQIIISEQNDSDASTDLERCAPECILLEDIEAPEHREDLEERIKKPKKSRCQFHQHFMRSFFV